MTTPADFADDLRVAVPGGQLFAVFQPQIDLRTGVIVAVEGLCRWQHPRHGLVPAQQFIDLAERSGLIHAIGEFMLAECFTAAETWFAQGRTVGVSVNTSPVQLASESFTEALAHRLRASSLPAETMTVEITESMPVIDVATVAPRLEALRELGSGVSLDDYGTGHASLDRLEDLPITELKLDRTLIQDEARYPAEDLSDLVAQAHARGIRVVAEGIETPRQLQRAETIGCDRAQGYLLGRPATRDAVDQILG
ncbi:EAL domain-containing protein [Microbacterium sp. CJ88]|uniref:EAL domain-containing protein n=1 Tax=Microbacterium sp. CJ88 TaxID=3445672 RepID=UPI003F65E3CC